MQRSLSAMESDIGGQKDSDSDIEPGYGYDSDQDREGHVDETDDLTGDDSKVCLELSSWRLRGTIDRAKE